MDAEAFHEFQQHPIRPYDPFYQRDHYNWNCAWDDYRAEVLERGEGLLRAGEIKFYNQLLNQFVDTVNKIYTYERATGTKFISFQDSAGRLVQSRSYWGLLDY